MCLIVPPSVAAQVVDIPDLHLRVVIAEQLGKASGAIITTADMANLTSLEAHQGVRDLTGLESATNLTRLLINGNISDLSPLAGLIQLNYLKLYNTYNLSDLSPLAGLTQLNYLELTSRFISDLSPLVGLTQLNHLQLSDTSVSDLSPLAGLTQLEHLTLFGASVSDISPLEGLTQLNYLQLSGASVSDLSPLEGLDRLTDLFLYGNPVSDLSPLAGLTQLESLGLSNTPISDLSPLEGLTQLESLGLPGTSVSDLSFLEGLTNLDFLSLNENNISDISLLEGLTNLYWLSLSDNNISDLSPLEGLDRLTDLYVKGNPLSYQSIHTHIPTLQHRGGNVEFDSRSVADLLNVSGVITASNNTLTILVRDSFGQTFAGVPVTFTVVSGGGILSATNTTTDEHGRAQSILTLGTGSRNSVEASVTGTALAIILSDTVLSEVKLPDPNLRAAVETLLGKASGAIITTADMMTLTHLHARNIDISDLTGLESATNLTYLSLNDNNISDISPLVANTGLGSRDHVHLWGNPLSSLSLNAHIPALRDRGVRVVPDEEAEPYTVGLIYLLPNDSQPRPNVEAQLDELIKEIQDGLAYWMEAHGFGRKTFTFQADAAGKAVVHHVNGRFNQAYYFQDQDGQYDIYAKWKVWDEIDEQFDSPRTIYVCFIDGGGGHSGLGSGNSLSGRAVIRTQPSANFDKPLAAHELMHAFGLQHHRLGDDMGPPHEDHISKRGPFGVFNSASRTEWLDVHRYLNPTQRSDDVSVPQVRMLPPRFVSPPNTIRLRFEVEDDGGLHQAQLLVKKLYANGFTDLVVVASKRLTGTHSTVEFVTTALGAADTDTEVVLQVIDVQGNFGNRSFPIDVASMIPPPYVVSVPDASLAHLLRQEVGIAPGDPITSHTMLSLSLWVLWAGGSRIADLTGIDSAVNMQYLDLNNNNVSDLSPLVENTGLRRGTYIALGGNPLSYQSIHTHIPILQSRGISVEFDNQAQEAPQTIADVNNDGVVNILDLVLIASSFGQSGQSNADVNGDGVVNILDLVFAAGMFDGAAAAPSAQPEIPETLTAVEVQGWLTDARSLEAKDPIIKRGFVILEQLLAALTPKETELLSNYPNPFNPETWIPYRLAEDAFVTLAIYDREGQVVRTLEIGHRIASAYESQSKAIYWDGRNDVGETVASGVYFYTLTAGEYSATRKMVILK